MYLKQLVRLLLLQDPGYVLQQALAVQSSPSKWPLLEKYAGHLRQQLVDAINHPQHREKPLMGLKIAVDAGNGSGGFFASQVRPSDCITSASQGRPDSLVWCDCVLLAVFMDVTVVWPRYRWRV